MAKKIRQKDGTWVNSDVFREEAIRYLSKGYYTEAPYNSPQWLEYWREQLRRCVEGYEVQGYKITGHHYCYLNFTKINRVAFNEDEDDEDEEQLATKEVNFPDFWDGDYNFFWALEIARNGICSKYSQVPHTEKQRKEWYEYNRQMRKLDEDTQEYKELKEKRDKISQDILDNLGLFVKPHLDYLNGGYHFIVGKDQPNSSIIKTPFGDKNIGDIKVGDIIYNSYSSMSKVVGVHPQGLRDVYEIELFDGRKTRCGYEHLWEIFGPIYKKNKRKHETLELKELLERPLKKGSKFTSFIKISEPVEKLAKDYIIQPYTLGAFLGDGNMIRQTRLSGVDEEIHNRVKEEVSKTFSDLELKITRRERYWEYSFVTGDKKLFKLYRDFYNYPKVGTSRINPLFKELEKLGVTVKGDFKFIPQEYKEGSIYQRLELVKGLMDTDGSITKKGFMTFTSKSERLVKDLQEVLYSLGIQATFRKRKDNMFILYINSNENLFHLTRKKNRVRKDLKSKKYVPITKITKLDYQEESTCITVDSEDHCYLTDEYIVTHNSRRKGYSFKNALIIANIYNTVRDKLTLLGAYEKKFMDETMEKVWEYLHFFNGETGFTKNRITEKKDFIKSGFVENVNGVNVEKGYKSRIDASRTFKDNPDAMRGVDGYFILFEESGAFDNLANSFNATYPSLTAGSKMTGQICIIGTSGDLNQGSRDYAEMFYNPIAYNLMPFYNTWDKDSENNVCGFFHPVTWNMEGFYDRQGNSFIERATLWENKRRKKIIENSNSSNKLNKHIQEFPLCPADAFSVTSFSIFPVEELRNRLNKVSAERLHIKKGIPVNLIYKDNKVVAIPDLQNKLEPIWGYKPKNQDLAGCPVIYEFPSPNAPKNFYKIGYDPYRQNEGTSLSSIIVFKGSLRGEKTKYKIVAEYYGRPQNADICNRIAMMFAELYNTQVMVENEVTHPITFFERNKKLHLLAEQPDNVISVSIKNSKVNRKFGCHMTDKIKEDCEKYVNNWLLEGYEDDYGNNLSTIDEIDSLGLLEELLQYNRKGNYDRMSALFMCMIQLQEQELTKQNTSNVSRVKSVMDFLKNNYYGNKAF